MKLSKKFIRDIIMAIFMYMDRHDLLPKSLCEDNIYYSSVLVSNLGSIDCGAIYHNLTDFGTSSILVTIGDIHKEQVINKDGKIEIKAKIPAINKILMAQTKSYKLPAHKTIVKSYILKI